MIRPPSARVAIRVIDALSSRKLPRHWASGEIANFEYPRRASALKRTWLEETRVWRSSS